MVGPSLPPGAIAPDAGTPFPAAAGFFAVDFDARGRVLFARPSVAQRGGSDVVALGEPVDQIRGAASYTVPFPLGQQLPDGGVQAPVLTRMDDLVCLPDAFTGSVDGCVYAAPTATQTVSCLSLVDGAQSTTVGTSTTTELGPPAAGGTAGAHGSARTYLAPNDVSTSCGPAWAFLGFPANLFVPQARTADAVFGTGCFAGTVRRLLPFPDGSFAVLLDVLCGNTTGQELVRVNGNGAITGSYLAKQGVPLIAPPLVLAALADGNVVTLRNDPPNTVFEAWPPDGSGPSATARVPGLYLYAGTPVPRLGRNVVSGANGGFTVLLNGATLGDVVLHVGPGLTPRWIYRYPALASTSTLVAADGEATVYYVDPLNNALVALDRRGGNSTGTTCVVTGVSVAASPSTVAAGATASLTATVSSSGPCSGGVSWSASPSGGTLVPSGNSATFSAAAPGTYTVTATSVADPSRAGSATVSVTGATSCGPPTGAVVTHTANIGATETWVGGGVTHAVPNGLSINGPATVTIQPCAIVSLGANATINVNAGASLVSAGTGPGGSISFVRANAAQPWGILRGTSNTSLIDLSWTTLQGGGAFGGLYANSAIAAVGNGYFVAPVPTVRVNNVTIDSPQGGGVYFDAGGAFLSGSTGLTVQGAPGYVLSMGMMALGSVPQGSYASASNALPMVNVVGTFNVTVDTTVHKYLPVRIQSGGIHRRAGSGQHEPGHLHRGGRRPAPLPEGERHVAGGAGHLREQRKRAQQRRRRAQGPGDRRGPHRLHLWRGGPRARRLGRSLAGHRDRLAAGPRGHRVRRGRQLHRLCQLQASRDARQRRAAGGGLQHPVRPSGEPPHQQHHPLERGLRHRRDVAGHGEQRAGPQRGQRLHRQRLLCPDLQLPVVGQLPVAGLHRSVTRTSPAWGAGTPERPDFSGVARRSGTLERRLPAWRGTPHCP